jgi:hypothetical protein
MREKLHRFRQRLLLLLVLGGCGASDGLELVPVSGKVTVDGNAVAGASVMFFPDASKGNKEQLTVGGATNAEGVYQLQTSKPDGKTGGGAPLGWYKVVVNTDVPTTENVSKSTKPVAIASKYKSATATDLSVEVSKTAPAGSYDFKLSP